MHGMSFNVDLDLAGFQLIVGCGLVGEKVSSLRAILGDRAPSLPTVRDHLARHIEQVLGRPMTTDLGSYPAVVSALARHGLG